MRLDPLDLLDALAQPCQQRAILRQLLEARGQCQRIASQEQESVAAVAHKLPQPSQVGRHDGHAHRKRLKDHHRLVLVPNRGDDDHVQLRKNLAERLMVVGTVPVDVREAVAPGAVVTTDGWTAYPGLARYGYTHRPRNISGSSHTASTLLPRVHRVAALLKRWLLGIHQGRVSRQHLDSDLDEFTFRFNRRTSRWRGKLFYRLVQQAVQVPPVRFGTRRRAAVPV